MCEHITNGIIAHKKVQLPCILMLQRFPGSLIAIWKATYGKPKLGRSCWGCWKKQCYFEKYLLCSQSVCFF